MSPALLSVDAGQLSTPSTAASAASAAASALRSVGRSSADFAFDLSMARCTLLWRSLRSYALCCIAVLNVVFIVFLHTQRPSADVSPVEPNIGDDSNNDEKQRHDLTESDPHRPRQFVASNRSPSSGSESLGQRQRRPRSSSRPYYGMAPADGDFCSNLTRHSVGIPSSAEEMTEETFQWQTVVRELRETFVFSAYYDRRASPAVVRIIGISNGKYDDVVGDERRPPPTKHCQLWLPNEIHPKVTLAEYSIVPETHDRSYAASFHTCRLENLGDVPYAVSLVNAECQSPSNVLRVLNHIDHDHQSTQFNFTVCVTPLNFNYDDYHQLVEMVEVNRLFGAQRFVFYNYSTGGQLDPYLAWYDERGSDVLRVIPWRLPVVVDVWPEDPKVEPEIHYFGQLAALNDCLYRNMLSSRFVVFTDLDELIVPRRHDTWIQMLNSIIRTRNHRHQQQQQPDRKRLLPTPGAFLFRNVFFRTDWSNRPLSEGAVNHTHLAVGLKLNTLLKMTREDRIYPSFVRSKYIAVPKTVSMVGVHCVISFIDDVNMTHVVVDEDDGLLHHYRQWIDDDLVTPVADDRMQRFAKRIISAVTRVHSHNIGLRHNIGPNNVLI